MPQFRVMTEETILNYYEIEAQSVDDVWGIMYGADDEGVEYEYMPQLQWKGSDIDGPSVVSVEEIE